MNPAVSYDFCIGDPISCLLTTLVGAFSMIVQLHRLIVYSTSHTSRHAAILEAVT